MFTRLHVKNFLSLKDVDIELGKVNVFIGPNASGKSNIARAFRLLAKHAKEGLPALEGYEHLRDLSFNFNPAVGIVFSLEKSVEETNYTLILSLTNEGYTEEILKGKEPIIRHISNSSEVYLEGKVISRVRGYFAWYEASRHIYGSMLTALPSDIEKEIYHLASDLRKISVYSFTPDRLRLRNPVSEPPFLKYHGDNLARYLLELYLKWRKDFGRVEETLRSMVPEIEEVIPHIEAIPDIKEANVEIWIKVKDIDEPLKPHNISDGTLRILALITALYSGSSLVVLEEPENCIHPYLLETLIYLVRDSPSQVVITTHSPHLLDHFKPEEVYLVEKEGLETKVKKLSSTSETEDVKRFLMEGGTLGEAWCSGIMGGGNP